MPTLQEAWTSLKRNPVPVYAYVLAMMAAGALYGAIDFGITQIIEEEHPPAWMPLYNAGMQVFFSALAGAIQAAALAMLGRELDKPLWKCEGGVAGLRRFLLPWFIINLLFHAAMMTEIRAAQTESQGLLATAEVLIVMMYVFAVPVGACVMFWGRFEWSELGEALSPLTTQIRLTLIVALLGFVGYFVHALYIEFLVRGYWTPIIGPALIQLPFATVDLLQFAVVWDICRLHRSTDDAHDDPFSF